MTTAEFATVKKISRPDMLYFVKPSEDPVFFPGMGADIVLQTTTPAASSDAAGGSSNR